MFKKIKELLNNIGEGVNNTCTVCGTEFKTNLPREMCPDCIKKEQGKKNQKWMDISRRVNKKEDYVSTLYREHSTVGEKDTDVYLNSSSGELSKLLKEFGTLRFFMNKEEDYIVWDAHSAFHNNFVLGNGADPEITKLFNKYDLRGQISRGDIPYHRSYVAGDFKGTSLYVMHATKFYQDLRHEDGNYKEIISNAFKQTKLYGVLKSIGLEEVEITKGY